MTWEEYTEGGVCPYGEKFTIKTSLGGTIGYNIPVAFNKTPYNYMPSAGYMGNMVLPNEFLR